MIAGTFQPLRIPDGDAVLEGDLTLPLNASSIVIFSHGSGSSRRSPRNRFVADILQAAGLGTLLFDLLTPDEEEIDRRTGELRFDIPFLADRLPAATDWLVGRIAVGGWGYFGASTGAAAALIAASERAQTIRAVVSRGGRPDLALDALPKVTAPTLLIVGENDTQVLELNRRAFALLRGDKSLEIVAGATHLFEEPGTLKEAARLAQRWFLRHLRSTGRTES